LKLAGFSFDSNPEFIELNGWSANQEKNLGQSVDNITTLVNSIGGVVDDPNKFDPFKSSVSSTTGNRPLVGGVVNKVTTTLDAISQIKKEREQQLEVAVADRELTVIKFTSTQTSMREVNMFFLARDKSDVEKEP
jgi:hypothetical protein